MIKGYAVLKRVPNRRWAVIFDTWYKSKHDLVVIHCANKEELKRCQNSLNYYKTTNELSGKFFSKAHENDLYIIRYGNTEYAMEVNQNEKGVIFYYDTTKTV